MQEPKRPIIGISSNILVMEGGMFPGILRDYVNRDYVESVINCGAIPVIIPVNTEKDALRAILSMVDGVILSGGWDINPLYYGEDPIWEQGFSFPLVDEFCLELIHQADDAGVPMWGICKGHQAINIAFGGTLYQDLQRQQPESGKHMSSAPRQYPAHKVQLDTSISMLNGLPSTLLVNSYHHQAIKKVADGFRVIAQAQDGVIEGIVREGNRTFAIGTQWHPEMMARYHHTEMMSLFENFKNICMGRRG